MALNYRVGCSSARCQFQIRAPQVSRQAFTRRGNLIVVHGLFDYLGDSVSAVFKNDETAESMWKKAGNPFSDNLFSVSSSDVEKVKALKKALQATRGCIDPDAVNFNPDATEDDGSCVYVPVEKAGSEDLAQYIGNAVSNLFTPMKDIKPDMPGYKVQPYEGRTATQAEIKKLMQFQDIVNRTLQEAEKKVEK